MPDIAPARPIAGQPIETSWGDAIHDALEGMQLGQVSVSLAAATSGTATVTFARPYATAPTVLVSALLNGNVWANVASVTTTQVVIAVRSPTAATVTLPVFWLAIGDLATPG